MQFNRMATTFGLVLATGGLALADGPATRPAAGGPATMPMATGPAAGGPTTGPVLVGGNTLSNKFAPASVDPPRQPGFVAPVTGDSSGSGPGRVDIQLGVGVGVGQGYSQPSAGEAARSPGTNTSLNAANGLTGTARPASGSGQSAKTDATLSGAPKVATTAPTSGK